VISKTKQSGRADLLVRMPPELKRRVEEAARREGMTRNEWVLTAIEAILKVQELHAEADEEIEAIRHKQDAVFKEILALLANSKNSATSLH
jgi:predicted DNA-binding protein